MSTSHRATPSGSGRLRIWERAAWATVIVGVIISGSGLAIATASSLNDPYAATPGAIVICDPATVAADGTYASKCHMVAPSTSTSSSPSPSGSPSASPSPSVTTASPSPSSASTTTTAPAPSPTTTPPTGPPSSMNCMPAPSRCGFPDSTNTGVTAGTTLAARSGTVRLTSGQTLANAVVTGCVQVTGPNVVIRNVRIISTCSYAAIDLEFTGASALIENVEIDMSRLANTTAFTGRLNQRSITGDDFTARRVWWHGGSDCVHYGSNVLIEDSFCDVASGVGYPGDPHLDGFQSAGGSNVTIRHNTIRNPNDQTSAIINGTTPGVSPGQLNVHIVGNLMAGGGYTVYCNAHQAATPATVEFRGNRISRLYYRWPINSGHPVDRGGFWGPTTDCLAIPGYTTNVWDEDGRQLPAVENPGVGQV
jgi:hypothetical protein